MFLRHVGPAIHRICKLCRGPVISNYYLDTDGSIEFHWCEHCEKFVRWVSKS